jgi:hypothetical protein
MDYFKADFSENEFNSEYVPCFGNFMKQCDANNRIYERVQPMDKHNKSLLMEPRPLSTSRCNLEEYNKQCYLFPPKTESIIQKHGNQLDKHYCQQNFVNIDDESFLKNINTKYTKINEFNIPQNIVPMTKSKGEVAIEFPVMLDPDASMFNQSTKRKLLLK